LFQHRSPDVWLTLSLRDLQPPALMAVTESGIESSPLQHVQNAWKTSPALGKFLKLSSPEKNRLDGLIDETLRQNETTLKLVTDRNGRSLRVLLEPLAEAQVAHRLLAAAFPEARHVGIQAPGKTAPSPVPTGAGSGTTPSAAATEAQPRQYKEWWPITVALVLLVVILIVARPYLLLPWTKLRTFLQLSHLHGRHHWFSRPDASGALKQKDLWFLKLIDGIQEAALAEESQPSENLALRRAALDFSGVAWRRAAQGLATSGDLPGLLAKIRPEVERWILQHHQLGENDNPGELIAAGRVAVELWRRQSSEELKLDTVDAFLKHLDTELPRLRAVETQSAATIHRLQSEKEALEREGNDLVTAVTVLRKELGEATTAKTGADKKASLLSNEKTSLTADVNMLKQKCESAEQQLAVITEGKKKWQIEAGKRAEKLSKIFQVADLVRNAQIKYWDKTQHPASTAVFLYIRYLALYQLLVGIESENLVSEAAGWINLRNLLSWIERSGVTNVEANDLEPYCKSFDEPRQYLDNDPEEILNARVLDHMTSGTSERGFNPAKLRAGSSWPILFRVDDKGVVGRAT